MFTGIIECTTSILDIKKIDPHLILRCSSPFTDVTLGESIALNGVCLTVTHFENQKLEFFVSHETLKRSDLSHIHIGSILNMERALKASQRISGHIVQGHVDSMAQFTSKKMEGESYVCEFTLPFSLRKYCVKKGSICISGISLTINEIIDHENESFKILIQIIPHTWNHTHLHSLSLGSAVNIEVDILAKYVENMTKYISS